MEPIISPWIVYLIGVLPQIGILMLTGSIIGVLSAIMITLYVLDTEYGREHAQLVAFGCMGSIIFCCIIFIAAFLIPDKTTLIQMYIASYITPDNIKLVHGDVLQLISDIAKAVKETQ